MIVGDIVLATLVIAIALGSAYPAVLGVIFTLGYLFSIPFSAGRGDERARTWAASGAATTGVGGRFMRLVSILGILGAAGLALAIVMIPVAIVSGVGQARFEDVAQRSTASVTDVPTGCARGCTFVVVRYDAASGHPVSARVDMSERPEKGSTIPVLYDPNDPQHVEAVDHNSTYSNFAITMSVVGLILALLGFLWNLWKRGRSGLRA